LEKINAKYKAATYKKRQVKLFEKRDMTSKIFNMADLYEHHFIKQLYPDYNSKMSSFEEGWTDVGEQGKTAKLSTAELRQLNFQLSVAASILSD